MSTRAALALVIAVVFLLPLSAGAQADRPLVYAQNVAVTAMDTAFTSGKIALGTNNASAQYDDVRVTAP